MPRETRTSPDLREALRIDEDNIDRCLAEHSELFFQAADGLALAVATRDGLKLELKELVAQLDQDVRRKALADEEKLSETALSSRITVLPKVKELNRQHLDACKAADRAEALRDSYRDRSFALRALNDSANARLYNLGIERGASSARGRLAERGAEEASRTREAAGVFDRRERSGSSQERYRSAKKDQPE
jgi:hypothetical protein